MLPLPALMRFENGAPVKTAEEMAQRREELLRILEEHAYGVFPAPAPVTGTVQNVNARCCSGNAREFLYEIRCKLPGGDFAFPARLFVPNGGGRKPLIVVINFRPSPYDEYIPVEEITENGFALAHLYYQDITRDDNDFSSGLAAYFDRTPANASGKIGLWAWSISRALDALLQNEEIDETLVGVIGHSRLGKTALWCAANDTRVKYVCSNDSGCMGASLCRAPKENAETVTRIAEVFPYWFCPRFLQYKENEAAAPFDQHFLLACAAPRRVLVNSASLDLWADPAGEQACCAAASPAWQAYGLQGFAGSAAPYGVNEGCLTGDIAYFKRYGIHFLGRRDWQNFMEFMKK